MISSKRLVLKKTKNKKIGDMQKDMHFIQKMTLKLDPFLDPQICHIMAQFGKKIAQRSKTIELPNILFLFIFY